VWIEASDRWVRLLLPVADNARSLLPNLERDLSRARMDMDSDRFVASAIARALQVGLSIGVSLLGAGVIVENQTLLVGGALATPLTIAFGGFTFLNYPKVRMKRVSRELEKDLPYALRHMLIEVRSGISLYEAMVSVSSGYGRASDEFDTIVRDINGGKPQVEALEDSIVRNPSTMYRRAMWQMINAMKSGTDVSNTLESLVESMVKQQKLQVERYGKELNPYILVYLMIAVIVPSLGVTFLIVLSTFTGTSLNRNTFFYMLGGLVLFQVFFLNFVKSKRPDVKS
jgi:flagellar protein FlaJ